VYRIAGKNKGREVMRLESPGTGRWRKSLEYFLRSDVLYSMKINTLFSLVAAGTLALSNTVFAGAKNYQVTGPIMEVNDSMIVVTKGKERFEIDRDANTKVMGELKVGAKVTIMYTMTAKEVEVKADKSAKKDAKASTGPSASPKK
jgi:hypothetical protein